MNDARDEKGISYHRIYFTGTQFRKNAFFVAFSFLVCGSASMDVMNGHAFFCYLLLLGKWSDYPMQSPVNSWAIKTFSHRFTSRQVEDEEEGVYGVHEDGHTILVRWIFVKRGLRD